MILLIYSATAVASRSLYVVGNSLTYDHRPDLFPAIPAQRQQALIEGWHIRASQNLNYIVSNPNDVSLSQPAPFDLALPGNVWSDVSLEPYPGNASNPSTLGSDIAAFQNLMALTKAGPSIGTRFYIYAAWPPQTSTNGQFSDYWRQSVANELTQPTVLSKQYYDALLQRLQQADVDGTPLHVIPIGDVMAALDDAIRAGDVPAITSINDIYRDPIHMGEVGQFLAAMTVYATLFGEDPSGLSIPAGYLGSGTARLSPELALQLQGIVWKVVSADPRAGVLSIHASPASLSFSAQPVGSSSAPQPLTITNDGLAPLNLASIDVSGDFRQTNDCPASLAVGSGCTVQVSFTPAVSGDHSGGLGILSGAALPTIALSGTAPIAATLSASPSVTTTDTSITLQWSASKGATCIGSGGAPGDGWAGPLTLNGNRSITEVLPGDLVYSMDCAAGSQTAHLEAPVSVSWPIVSATLSASPSTITTGQSTTLSWSSANTTLCSASGGGSDDGWTGSKPISGSQVVIEKNAVSSAGVELTFELTCTSAVSGLSSRATAKVTENAPVPASSGGGGGFDWQALGGLLALASCTRLRRSRARAG